MGERCKYPPCREPEFCGWAAYCGATDILGDHRHTTKTDVGAKTMAETLTLKEAAERYRLKLATLRHEARAGRLVVYKMGKAFYTTPADIADMVQKCRVKPAPTSISTGAETRSASGMALDQSELDAVLLTRLQPKSSSRNTSPASIARRQRQVLGSGT
jgi:hypothetical protein